MMLPKSVTAFVVGSTVSATIVLAPMSHVRSSTEAYQAFGRSVAISGEYAFVGEPNVGGFGRGGGGGGAPPAAGVVHVYRVSAAGWKLTGDLSSSAASGGDGFGTALAVDGATLLVGQVRPAPAAFGGGGGGRGGAPAAPPAPDTAVGSVEVFKRSADLKWTSGGMLKGATAAAAQYGSSIALSGDLALVGAPGDANGGSVYVFERSKDGRWSAAGTLPAQTLVTGDRFGAAIAIDGNRVAVGAPMRKGKGAMLLFKRDAGTWTQETEQTAPAMLPERAQFGSAVAVKGDRVIVGAPSANFAAQPANLLRDSLLAALGTTPPGPVR